MDFFDFLLTQFWVGVIQLSYAVIVTLIQVVKTKRLTLSLKRYWLFVAVYFLVLFTSFQLSEEVGMIWLFTAWGIAIYWFFHFISWVKDSKRITDDQI